MQYLKEKKKSHSTLFFELFATKVFQVKKLSAQQIKKNF